MSFDTNLLSREAIQAIQFELWPDCFSGCKYCYLNGTPRHTTIEQKQNNLRDAFKTLQSSNLFDLYNAVGVIGGDFFQGQLRGVEDDWYNLMDYLNALMHTKVIKEVWIATSLIEIEDIQDIYDTLDRFQFDRYDSDQVVRICTSYDTVGRFVYHFRGIETATPEELEELERLGIKEGDPDPEKEEDWRNSIIDLFEKYPKISIHVQIILTQDVINKLIEDPNYFDFITDMGCIIDFRYPSITRADCPSAVSISDYRSLLLKEYQNFPPHFFIEERASFLQFLKVLDEKYGLEKVRNLVHQPEMRSRRLKIYIDDVEILDRWNDPRDVYLPCGHLVDGLCYIDSEKCIYCDIEKYIELKENN